MISLYSEGTSHPYVTEPHYHRTNGKPCTPRDETVVNRKYLNLFSRSCVCICLGVLQLHHPVELILCTYCISFYVGRAQVCRHLAQVIADGSWTGVTWGIAGRSKAKLEEKVQDASLYVWTGRGSL